MDYVRFDTPCTHIGQHQHAPELLNAAHFRSVTTSFLCQVAIFKVRTYLRFICD